MKSIYFVLLSLAVLASCGKKKTPYTYNLTEKRMKNDSTSLYGYNRDFLKKHVGIIELKNENSSVVIVPAWQGRVMTSSSDGDSGFSYGWINHNLIKSGVVQPHINAFGGEERLWLGPEGGQYSLFFRKGADFTFENWYTPDYLDTKPFDVISLTDTSASFSCTVSTENYSGSKFNFIINRTVTLLDAGNLKSITGVGFGGVQTIAYRSDNSLTNLGPELWKKESGLISVWMLGMFNPSPSVVVVIPYQTGDNSTLGHEVNDNYFGKIPPDRLKVTSSHILFRADGRSRGKIGISPLRSKGILGSYDSQNKVLTLLMCKQPEGVTEYVNSSWQIQEKPYSGDALNSYNDGPLEDGSQMGPFYELETSSPAYELKQGEITNHTQVTIHLNGNTERLNQISLALLGLSLEEIGNAF